MKSFALRANRRRSVDVARHPNVLAAGALESVSLKLGHSVDLSPKS